MFEPRSRTKSFSSITGTGKNDIDIARQINMILQGNPEVLETLTSKIKDIQFFKTCFKNQNFKVLKVILGELLKPARMQEQSAQLQNKQIANNHQINIQLTLQIQKLQAERAKLVSNNQRLKSQLIIKREETLNEGNMQLISSQGLVSKVKDYEIQHSVLFEKPRLYEEIQKRKVASQPKPIASISEQPQPSRISKQISTPPQINKFNLGNAPDLFSIKTELTSKLSAQQSNKMLNSQQIPQYNIGDELYMKQAKRQRKMNNSLRLNPRFK